ncbi:MAG: hypothetical protein BGN82_03830 [Alphaproteobacteria bacterium 65-7]|nr:MAG: hypothetical protein BGN82_03830 [Alphaproteobacteria bacterium 65-7]
MGPGEGSAPSPAFSGGSLEQETPFASFQKKGAWPMKKSLDDTLDPKAKGKKTPQADFDRNREGLYGGLPEARKGTGSSKSAAAKPTVH